jgi:thiosulfate dehydrogenase (quinone) large subunit
MMENSVDSDTQRTDAVLGYTVLRLALGVDIAMHGLSRFIGGLDHFAKPTIALFAHTILPAFLVVPMVYTIPFVETIAGTLILLGLWTRYALLLNALLMLALIFGTCIRQDWMVLSTQIPYPVIIALLLFLRRFNAVSLDFLAQSRQSALRST